MNRAKKEEIKRYNEARRGLSKEAIAELDAKEAQEAEAEKFLMVVHDNLFPEEYDSYFDSCVDSKMRRRGINPMSGDYIQRTNKRRESLGIAPLNPAGSPIDNASKEFCRRLINKHSDRLAQIPTDKEKLHFLTDQFPEHNE